MMLHFSKIDNVFLCVHPTFLESDLHHGVSKVDSLPKKLGMNQLCDGSKYLITLS